VLVQRYVIVSPSAQLDGGRAKDLNAGPKRSEKQKAIPFHWNGLFHILLY